MVLHKCRLRTRRRTNGFRNPFPKKNERTLYKLINQLEPRAFIISYEPKFISGGFGRKVRKRNDAISH